MLPLDTHDKGHKMPNEGEETINAFQQYYNRPMEIPTKEPLRTFIYNPKTKAVFGRTSSSWRKILLSSFIIYSQCPNSAQNKWKAPQTLSQLGIGVYGLVT